MDLYCDGTEESGILEAVRCADADQESSERSKGQTMKGHRNDQFRGLLLPVQICMLSVLCGYMVFLARTTPYSIDDFCFVTYPQGGFLQFVQNLIDHYRIYNGRTWLHWLLSLNLYGGRWVFPVVSVAVMLLIPWILWKILRITQWGSDDWMIGRTPDNTGYLSCAVLSSALFLAMPSVMKTDGVLWQSGYFNYIFPFPVFLYLLYLLIRLEKERDTVRFPQWAWLCFISFLTGSSTEQFALPAICMEVCLALRSLTGRRERIPVFLTSALSSTAGILVILLAPSMQNRIRREHVLGDLSGNLAMSLKDQCGFFMKDAAFHLLLSVSVLLTVFLYCHYENLSGYSKKKGVFIFVLDLLLILFSWALSLKEASLLSYVFCLMSLVCTGFRLIFEKHSRYAFEGMLLLSAFTATVMALPSESYGSRLIVPMYMLLSFLLVVCAASLPVVSSLLQISIFLFSTLLMYETGPHYLYNYRIETKNEQFMEQLKTTHELWYDVDYDKAYTRDKIDRGGIYLQGYLKQSGFDGRTDQLYVYSRENPGILYKGERVSWYAKDLYGETCLPIRYVIEAAGGSVSWNDKKESAEIHLNGLDYHYSGHDLTWSDDQGEHRISVRDTRKDLEIMYFPKDIVEEVFGIHVTLTSELPPGK